MPASNQQLTPEEGFLFTLIVDRKSVGIGKARELFPFGEVNFDKAKAALLTKGIITIGRGRGGSLQLAEPKGPEAAEPNGLMTLGLPATQPPVTYPKRGPGRPPKAQGQQANGQVALSLEANG